MHISNRHLSLGPVVREIANDCGMKISRISATYTTEEENAFSLCENEWVLVTRNDDFLTKHPSTEEFFADDAIVVPLWTDDYSNLYQILSGSFWEKLNVSWEKIK